MKPKEDIGKAIEEQLQKLDSSLSNEVWNRINTSLDDQQKKKRRKGFLFWLSGGAIGILLGLLLTQIVLNGTTSQLESIEKSTQRVLIENDDKVNYTTLKKVFATMEIDTTGSSFKDLKDLKNELPNLSNKDTNSITTIKRKLKDNTYWIEESNAMKTRYYYYNDSTKQSTEIEDPKVIDSIIKSNPKTIDSIIRN